MFETIGITTKREVEDTQLLEELVQFLLDSGKKVFLSVHAQNNLKSKFSELPSIDYSKKFDLLIALGGDGTLLRASRNLQNFSTALLGINGGHLGFLTTMGIKDWQENLQRIFDGKFTKGYKAMFRVRHERDGETLLDTRILNDAVISYKNVARLITVDAKVDTRNMCRYVADGLIISTPTGSTAYNLAAGGPIVYPSIEASIVTPICSHSFTQKPIVIPGHKKLSFEFTGNDEDINLTLDGQRSFTLQKNDKVKIEMMKDRILVLRMAGEHFFKTLRKKLSWGENPR